LLLKLLFEVRDAFFDVLVEALFVLEAREVLLVTVLFAEMVPLLRVVLKASVRVPDVPLWG
jgi:hypothetical protein